MRDFAAIERELGLVKQGRQRHATLYVVPVRPGAPRIVVARFDADLPPALVPACAALTRHANDWLDLDPDLAFLLQVQQPTEIGTDFIAREQILGTNYRLFFSTEETVEPPPQFDEMRERLRVLAGRARGEGDARFFPRFEGEMNEPSARST